jgi:hypothetical protein
VKYALLLMALSSVAYAETVKPPAGWLPDPPAAASLVRKLGELPHLGSTQNVVTVSVYRTEKASLIVTRIAGNVKAEDRDRLATAELVEIEKLKGSGAPFGEVGVPSVIADKKWLDAHHGWTDRATGVTNYAWIRVAANDQVMVAAIGECVAAVDAKPELQRDCIAALATLDPDLAPATRVPLKLEKIEIKPPPPPEGSAKSAPSLVESGERPSLPPMQIPQEQKEPDRRPVYVGLGLIVLAVIFYWNRKNREKLERDYEKRTADKPEQPEDKPKADRDADDLHAAAAAGDTKEDEKS